MDKDIEKSLERDVRQRGLRLMGELFDYTLNTLRDQQREFEDAEKAQAAQRKRLNEKREMFEKEWQRRNPRGM